MREFFALLKEINIEPGSKVDVSSFYQMISDEFEMANDQQDSYELYNRLMERLEVEVDFNKNPFKLTQQSTIECVFCGFVKQSTEFSYEISLSLGTSGVNL